MTPSLALLLDSVTFADFADRETVLAFVRGAVARGVRVVALHETTVEATFRAAAASAVRTPSVETGETGSVQPLVFVRGDQPAIRQLDEERPREEEEHDDLVEWRGTGASWQSNLAEALSEMDIRLVVGFGDRERTRTALDAATTLIPDVPFLWSIPIESSSRPISTLGKEESGIVEEVSIDLDRQGLDEEERPRVDADLRNAVSKVLHAQKVLTEYFGKIPPEGEDLEERAS